MLRGLESGWGLTGIQIEFDDPNQEWEIVNAWFVKQNNFTTRFKLREIVKPGEGVQPAKAH